MKTHYKKLSNPNYLGHWDLMDSEGRYLTKTFTITNVTQELVHDGKGGSEDKMVMYLQGVRPMIMNATNQKTMIRLTGSPFIEDWVGKQVTITVAKVKAFGDIHDALRITTSKADRTADVDKINALLKTKQVPEDMAAKIDTILKERKEGEYAKVIQYLEHI